MPTSIFATRILTSIILVIIWRIFDFYNVCNGSGLKVGHTCWPIWPTEQSGCDPHMTHLWPPICWRFLFKSIVTGHEKLLMWNNAIDFFILGRIQNHSLAQTPWRWNLWTPHASKQLGIISWFHTNDNSVHSSDPKFTHLPDANTVFWRTCDIRVTSR